MTSAPGETSTATCSRVTKNANGGSCPLLLASARAMVDPEVDPFGIIATGNFKGGTGVASADQPSQFGEGVLDLGIGCTHMLDTHRISPIGAIVTRYARVASSARHKPARHVASTGLQLQA